MNNNIVKKTLFSIARWFYSNIVLKRIYAGIYRRNRKKPVQKNKVIFLNEEFTGMRDSFELLYEYLQEEGKYEIHCAFLGKKSVPKKEYFRQSAQLIADLATAKYVFLDIGSELVSCVDLRPETTVVQLWHACGAFKRFGFSTLDAEFGKHLRSSRAHPLYRNLSLCTVSSPEVVWAYEEAMDLQNQTGIVRPVGVSRTDIYYRDSLKENALRELREHFPAAAGKKIILFAPTFRGRTDNARTAENFDPVKIIRAFGDEYVLIMKHHPHVPDRNIPAIPDQYKDKSVYDASKTMPIASLLCLADICITDYSSIIFEYALLERPMIFFAYDLEQYFDERGFYYPYDEIAPGPIVRTNEEIIDYIQHIEERFDRQKVVDFKNKFMSACDGHATERILETIHCK